MKENKYLLLIFIIVLLSSCSYESSKTEQIESTSCSVSLVPSITDFLGEISPDDIVAVSKHCDASFLNDSIPRINTYPQIDYENLLKYKSCNILVLEGFINNVQVEKLKDFDFDVIQVKDKTISDLINVPIALSSEKGKKLSNELGQQFHDLLDNKISESQSYLVMISNKNLQVYGDGNYLTELFDTLGFSNVAQNLDGAYPEIKSEYFFNHLPDLIISSDSVGVKLFLESKYPHQKKIRAIKHVQINKNLLFRAGPRFLECGETLLKAIK